MSNENRFKYLSNEPPAVIPVGTFEPFEFKTTRERMAERAKWIASTKTCECCKGLGRVPK